MESAQQPPFFLRTDVEKVDQEMAEMIYDGYIGLPAKLILTFRTRRRGERIIEEVYDFTADFLSKEKTLLVGRMMAATHVTILERNPEKS